MRRKTVRRLLRIDRHYEKHRLDRLHEIESGVARVPANASRFDRNIGLSRRIDEFLQRRPFFLQSARQLRAGYFSRA